jgi:hypothetical protein
MATKNNSSVSTAGWPGAFGVYKNSKRAVMLNIGAVLLLLLTSILVSVLTSGYDSVLVQVLVYIFSTFVGAALTLVYLGGARGQKLSIGEALNKALPLVLPVFLLEVLVLVSVAASLLALIIPFFFVMPRLVLASYFLIDQKMGVLEAYKASWNASKGHAGKVWGIIGVTILYSLIAITIIGIPLAIYLLLMYSAAMALLYLHVSKQPSL